MKTRQQQELTEMERLQQELIEIENIYKTKQIETQQAYINYLIINNKIDDITPKPSRFGKGSSSEKNYKEYIIIYEKTKLIEMKYPNRLNIKVEVYKTEVIDDDDDIEYGCKVIYHLLETTYFKNMEEANNYKKEYKKEYEKKYKKNNLSFDIYLINEDDTLSKHTYGYGG